MAYQQGQSLSVVISNGPAINPGRSTEHLGFCAVARRHGFKNVTFFDLLPFTEYFARRNAYQESFKTDLPLIQEYYAGFPIQYNRLLGSLHELRTSDALLFWSGWLHTPQLYEHYRTALVEMAFAQDEAEAVEIVDSHLYLGREDDATFGKTVAFGETILNNTISSDISSAYGAAYQRFYKRTKHVYMRDIVSAQKISSLKSDHRNVYLGADCATLLTADDVDCLPSNASEDEVAFCKGKVAVFFGRSDIDPANIQEVASYLCDRFNTAAFSLPWGTHFSFPQTKALPLPSPMSSQGRALKIGDPLRMIKEASVVLTDTYHVFVNAWSMGVPAICIGAIFSTAAFDRNSGPRFSSIDKRYTFYSMFDALEFYIHEQELSDPAYLRAHLQHIGGLIEAALVSDKIALNVRNKATQAEACLVQSLQRILAES